MTRIWHERAENVVVGGGVIGLAVAHELLRRGLRVLLLERGRPGHGATAAAGGMLAPVSEAPSEPDELIELGRDSLARYPEFVAGIERITGVRCGYRTEGTLWVALHEDDCAELHHVEQTLAARGLGARWLSAAELQEREPHLSGRVQGGLLAERDHQVDPRALAGALALAVRARGGRIATGVEVRAVECGSRGVRAVRARTTDGLPVRIETARVILAAGAWSARGLELPVSLPGFRPVKGQLVRLFGPALVRHVLRTPDVYLVPRESGELLVGATMEEMGFDASRTAGAVMDLLRHAWEVLPGTYDLEFREVSVGLRSAVDDHLPLIGPSGVDGLFLATAHFRNGVLLAPATAHHLAETITSGQVPRPLAAFDPTRVARPAVVRPRTVVEPESSREERARTA